MYVSCTQEKDIKRSKREREREGGKKGGRKEAKKEEKTIKSYCQITEDNDRVNLKSIQR